ncbi:hypothetical protein DRQ50_02730 [bacterium]|nr:MAG: hypothetical protein DRQ50_02730 [bacterium]
MGRVYKAEDKVLGRTVALKFLAPELAANPSSVERFLREARMLADLDHANICTIHEIAQDDDGAWFIAMTYYEGMTLKHKLADGPLDGLRALDYARQTAIGLAYAHEHGIIHRDIKPANLIVTPNEEIKILDFGVARLVDGTQFTAAGALVGTYGYLAPEQTRGEQVTAASDIWSLGVVLFEMTTGGLPFTGDGHAAQLYAIAHDEPVTLPVTDSPRSQARAAIVEKCLAKDPQDRFESAGELAVAIGEVLAAVPSGTSGTFAMPTWTPATASRQPRRALYSALGAAVMLLAVFLWPHGLERLGLAGTRVDRTGVAVLPFEFLGGGDPATDALGRGLAWNLNDQLDDLDHYTDAFWMVPASDLKTNKVQDRTMARDRLGAWRVVTGTGRYSGSNIVLKLSVFDTHTGKRQEIEFQDPAANLSTWQEDVVTWVVQALDPDFPVAGGSATGLRAGTKVPSAFMDYCRGMGYLNSPTDDDFQRSVDRALVALSAAVAADSSFAPARAELGYAQWRHHAAGDTATASLGRSNLMAALQMDSTLVRGYLLVGRVLDAEGDTEGELAAYRSGLRLDPVRADLLKAEGDALYATGDKQAAYSAFERYIAVRPGYAPGHEYLARCQAYSGDLDLAEKTLEDLLEFAPRNHVGIYFMGSVINFARRDPAAENLFLESLAIHPTSVCYANLGSFYYYAQRYEDALLSYRSAASLNPQHDLWRNIAEAYRWSGGYADSVRVVYKRAINVAERKLDDDPSNPGLLAELASYNSVLGNKERALELLDTLSGLRVVSGETAMTVATAYEDLGYRDAAFAHLDTALALGVPHTMVENYPGFRNLRSDARYQTLMDQYR